MANWYVSSVAWTAVTAWAASTAYSVGDLRRQLATPTVGNERVWRCTTAGTSGGSEPAWTLTKGSTTSDNTAVWTEVTGQETYHTPGSWLAPHARLANAFGTNWAAAGDPVYVASNHAETQSSAMTILFSGTLASPNYVACIDESASGHIPPVAGDLKTTATVSTTGSSNLTIGRTADVNGITFSCGTSTGSPLFTIGSGNTVINFKNCVLKFGATGICTLAISAVNAGSGAPFRVTLDNTPINFASTSSGLVMAMGHLRWINTPSALPGSVPTNLFLSSSSTYGAVVQVEGVDLSAMVSGKTLVAAVPTWGYYSFKDCKLGSAAAIAATPTGVGNVTITRTDSAGVNYRSEAYQYSGSQVTETTVIRTGGASDGTTGLSWLISSTANAKWVLPFQAVPCAIWNDVTGSNVTATMHGIWNAAALPNDEDIWANFEYLGASSSPLGTFATTTKATNLTVATALSASTESWDSLATARANSTAYTLGQIRKVASNPGRIFFCTTAGTSSGSEPAGYATAVDGGSVTDGTAVFRAGVRWKLSFTMSSPQPAQKGALYAYLHVGKASASFYVDPLIVLS